MCLRLCRSARPLTCQTVNPETDTVPYMDPGPDTDTDTDTETETDTETDPPPVPDTDPLKPHEEVPLKPVEFVPLSVKHSRYAVYIRAYSDVTRNLMDIGTCLSINI